jgi:glycosyltransferase involved in cell wall biosynthesis
LNNSKDINKKSESVCAIIPFYNEKDTLNTVLDETAKFVDYIIAVNDGSNDYLYLEERKKSFVEVIDLDKNFGKGKALSFGFEKAVSAGYDYVITLDADLQHDPNYIPELIYNLKVYDIVVGNRLNNLKGMPLQRRLSNKLTSLLLTIKTGQEIFDSQCGFRAYRRIVLEQIKTHYSGFEAESEILIKAAKKGFKIGFIDISTIYGNEKSKMRPLDAIIGFLRVLLSNVNT